jgi:iron(III) transport system ATP-binding protein
VRNRVQACRKPARTAAITLPARLDDTSTRLLRSRDIMPGVSVDSVSKRFGTVRAVDGVSLAVADGRLLTLLGPSGCGKTTTLRMIAGLEQNDAGRITIGDRLVSDPASGLFVAPERREIGMVFQSYAIWPHMTVFANVAYPLEVRRRPTVEVRERVQGALRLMEMEHLAARPATALSGGQQQRVAIARALVFQPRVLLMDEPLSNLDAKLREQMRVELRALQQRLGITTVYVTHDQEEAMVLSDEIAMMHEGRVLQVAAPETIYTRPTSRTVAAFFGSPNLLAVKAREVRRASGRTLARVEGEGWEGWCLVPDDVQAGEALTVVARPEMILLGGPAPPTGLAWRGVVRQRFFRGTRNLYTIEAGAQRLSVDAPPEKALAPGTEVTLGIDAEHTWAVRG